MSIRDITQAADCNVAAVNYYFGNKENLYFDVFRQRIIPKLAELKARIAAYLAGSEAVSLESAIRAFVSVFVNNIIFRQEHDAFHRLVNSERFRPTKARDIIINEALIPFYQSLIGLMRPYFPAHISEKKMKLHVLSIISMVLYFSHSRQLVTGFTGNDYKETFVNELIDHMVDFTMNGINKN